MTEKAFYPAKYSWFAGGAREHARVDMLMGPRAEILPMQMIRGR